MKRFRNMLWLTTLATYMVIFVGGLVRVSGAGLGCPDWPKCYGRWIPPFNVSQLPVGIDPAQFNFVLAWTEYINRVLGAGLGLLILITAVWAFARFRHIRSILYPTVAALLLVAVVGWQGSIVIASELQPAVVTVHMLLALLIASLLIYASWRVYLMTSAKAGFVDTKKRALGSWPALLWVLALGQVALGTQMRQALELLTKEFPLLSGVHLVNKMSGLSHVHLFLGCLVGAVTLFLYLKIRKEPSFFSSVVRSTTNIMGLLILAQVSSGLFFMFFGIAEIVRVFHLWMASLFTGAALVLYASNRQSARSPVREQEQLVGSARSDVPA